MSALNIVCVGSGRDGTLSLTKMMAAAYGGESAVMHEYASAAFYEAFCGHRETGEPRHLETARRLILDCPYACIVGNGYAPFLPLFAELAPEATLVHVRRARETCVPSLTRNATLFPFAYGYYVPAPAGQAQFKRFAAFHFGEMSRTAWDALALTDKIAWYYDKTHALIGEHAPAFARALEIRTEDMSKPFVGAMIAHLVPGALPPSPAHLNTQGFAADVSEERRARIQWLMGRFDLVQAADDDLYPLEYFLNAFIGWTGYQIHGSEALSPADVRSDAQLAALLERAEALLGRTSALVRALETQRQARAAAP